MRTEELDYKIPEKLIAKKPAHPRDAAKLLYYDESSQTKKHLVFRDIKDKLTRGDVLVLNNTKVFPARVRAKKQTGGGLEVVFLSEIKPKIWEVIIGGKAKEKDALFFYSKNKVVFSGKILKKSDNIYELLVDVSKKELYRVLEKIGETPLPPYIKRKEVSDDKREYQTVYAQKVGSAAAPTAGLHFTKGLLDAIKRKGVEVVFIDLTVGLGTFAPIKTKTVEAHPIHEEFFAIPKKTAEVINQAKREGRRIIACGTTVVRALESAKIKSGRLIPKKGQTKLFIYPGFKFGVVDGIITNFHTPKSSLLALVFAFIGKKKTKELYQEAIKNKYRFFSYGDAMLILKKRK